MLYVLNVMDSNGWPLGPFPEPVTVEGLSTREMAFQVTLPLTRGDTNSIQVTVTSQTDPTVSATQTIQVGVAMDDTEMMVPVMPQVTLLSSEGSNTSSLSNSGGTTMTDSPFGTTSTFSLNSGETALAGMTGVQEGGSLSSRVEIPSSEGATLPGIAGSSPSFDSVIMIRECPSTGVISSVCSNRNRTIRDATFEASAKVSGGELAGMIKNFGFISQVTIQPETELSGGTLIGYIVNQGTLQDFTFVGASIQGGTLAGTITNLSQVGGTFVDVTLAPHARVKGGKLTGRIQGDQKEPAFLENVRIVKGSHVSGVTLGKGVVLEEEVKLEE